MVNFSGGDWIVKALKLLAENKTLRHMYYAALAVVLVYGFVRSPVLVELTKALLSHK